MTYDRLIRSELYESERFLDLASDTARLIFVALLCEADDFGNLRGGERRLYRWAHGFATVKDPADVIRIFSELCDHDLIRRYVVDSKPYFHIPRFRNQRTYAVRHCPPSPWCDPNAHTGPYKADSRPDYTLFRPVKTTPEERFVLHQRLDSLEQNHVLDKPSTIGVDTHSEKMPQNVAGTHHNRQLVDTNSQPNQQLTLKPDSDLPQTCVNPDTNLKIGLGVGRKTRALPRVALRDDWTIPSGWIDWAISHALESGHRTIASQWLAMSEAFADWHRANGVLRANYLAAWRNWVRRADLARLASENPDRDFPGI